MQVEFAGIPSSILRDIVIPLWPDHWKIIVIFFVSVLVAVIFQILLLRGGGHSKLSPGFNRLVGGVTFAIVFALVDFVANFIFGSRITNIFWFAGFGIIAFLLTHFALTLIGFWYY